VNEDVAAYGLLNHPHVSEMRSALSQIGQTGIDLTFTPHLVPMTRGLLATCYARGTATGLQCLQAARSYFANREFVRVVETPPHTKWALGTNLVFLSYVADPARGVILALAGIDNLGKGAAGQAIQNANLMTGQPAVTGLLSSPLWP
ncbi:MAG: N-acetyl-gamma-glutamyl-phosphate reductase, partial [Tepidisphaeraceae bacterium]